MAAPLAALALGIALWAGAPQALADKVVCEAGEAPADCTEPRGVAVDRDASLLYVAENGIPEIDVFAAETGAHESSFAVAASGPSTLSHTLTGVAVDNDAASPASGDVYVLVREVEEIGVEETETTIHARRYTPAGAEVLSFGEWAGGSQAKIATGPGGSVYVATDIGGGDRQVEIFDHEGNPVETCSPLEPGEFGGNLHGLAVTSGGNFFLANGGNRFIEEYEASCAWLESSFHRSFNIRALASDSEDDLYVSDSTGAGEAAIYAYSPADSLFKVIYGDGTVEGRPNSLAPLGGAGEDVFAVESQDQRRVVRVSYPEPGPVVHPDPTLSSAEPSNTSATLNTWINPEGKATEYRFQYVDRATYEEEGFASPAESEALPLEPPAEPSPEIPSAYALSAAAGTIGCPEASPEAIEEGKCLAPETEYVFRAVAVNADGEDVGPEASFETEEPWELVATYSTRVGATAARVHATANPFGIPLTGSFEYVDQQSFEESGFAEAQSTEAVDFGGGEEPSSRGVQLSGLEPDTTYRYRAVLENFFTQEAGGVASFTTFSPPAAGEDCANDSLRGGASARLPDCRAYEMVSPPDKEGGEILVRPSLILNLPAELNKGAAGVAAAGEGFTYSSYRSFGEVESAPYTAQYIATRHPLGSEEEGWLSRGVSPRREGAFIDVELETQFKIFSDDLRYAWLRTDSEPTLDEGAVLGYLNLYRRSNASDAYTSLCMSEPANLGGSEYVPEPQGHSADGAVTVFRANDALEVDGGPKAAEVAGLRQLYACGPEGARVASVLPAGMGGEASTGNSSAGTALSSLGDHRELSLHNAVSDDAQRIYWTDSGATGSGVGPIYVRERPFAAGGECASEAAPCTKAVSEAVGGAGSEADAFFWTASADGERAIFSFTAGTLEDNLYAYDAKEEEATLIAEGVSGLAGWSEDARRLYFVSSEALAEGAEAGKDNLYLFDAAEGGSFELVAVLEGGTIVSTFCAADHRDPIRRCTRATPDGGALAFVSRDPLTGYNNADAASGGPDAEVFLYDAVAEELVCVSCNPTGARPQGREGIAAQIPSWESAFQASRLLSADGERLFFESYDALAVGDTNGVRDVYQWERAGKGSCDATDPDHFPQNGGCLSLISSGENPEDAEFVDASADGSDVFFKTSESLVPQDPGLVDIYDARIGGGFPAPAPPRPPCEGEACQNPPGAPPLSTPSSETFEGPGNPLFEPPRLNCTRFARTARVLSVRAKRLRRVAARAARRSAPRKARALRGRAARRAKRAARLSAKAKRCRRQIGRSER